MKRKNELLTVFFIVVFQFAAFLSIAQSALLETELKKFPEVVSVNKIVHNSYFIEAYEIIVSQFLDHKNPSAGKFNQRVIISHYNTYSPVIYITEGYDADYAVKETYINELSKIVEANQIVVEHRYFGKSMPSDINWDYLTIENACADLHMIRKLFQRIYNYKNKWIATGISKGGQNCMAYKAFYPNDVDIWISYVAPLNFALEEKRHEKFLKKVGAAKCRNDIEKFQFNVLKNRGQILPKLDSLISVKEYTYRISSEEVLDYCLLEYPFAFWQWGRPCNSVPTDSSSVQELFEHLILVSSPSYFSNEETLPIQAFFVQAAKEFGYYGYDTKKFQPLMKVKTANNYIDKLFLPKDFSCKFSNKTSKFIQKAINKNGDHTIFIYGEYDPWTASSIKLNKNSKAVKIVSEKGNHRLRIFSMPYMDQAKISMLLDEWLIE